MKDARCQVRRTRFVTTKTSADSICVCVSIMACVFVCMRGHMVCCRWVSVSREQYKRYIISLYQNRWVVVYPVYMNRNRKICDGRKLPLSACCEDPPAAVIAQCAARLSFQTVLEPMKKHPRDFFEPGRIRVRLFNDDGSAVKESVRTRLALYREISALVPSVKMEMDQQRRLQQKNAGGKGKASSAATTTSAAASGSSGGSGKSGKAGGKAKGKKKGKR